MLDLAQIGNGDLGIKLAVLNLLAELLDQGKHCTRAPLTSCETPRAGRPSRASAPRPARAAPAIQRDGRFAAHGRLGQKFGDQLDLVTAKRARVNGGDLKIPSRPDRAASEAQRMAPSGGSRAVLAWPRR